MVELNAALYLFDITISLARVGVEPTAVALTVAHWAHAWRIPQIILYDLFAFFTLVQ